MKITIVALITKKLYALFSHRYNNMSEHHIKIF